MNVFEHFQPRYSDFVRSFPVASDAAAELHFAIRIKADDADAVLAADSENGLTTSPDESVVADDATVERVSATAVAVTVRAVVIENLIPGRYAVELRQIVGEATTVLAAGDLVVITTAGRARAA